MVSAAVDAEPLRIGVLPAADAIVIHAAADEKLYKTLGINVCCEPKYEQHRFYHK